MIVNIDPGGCVSMVSTGGYQGWGRGGLICQGEGRGRVRLSYVSASDTIVIHETRVVHDTNNLTRDHDAYHFQ